MTDLQQPPKRYQIRLDGHLDQHWSTWFGGFTLSHEEDATTTLSGLVTDQAELYGLLAKVRDVGATLISVTPEVAVHRRAYDDAGADAETDAQRQHHS